MMTLGNDMDYSELKRLAEAAKPTRIGNMASRQEQSAHLTKHLGARMAFALAASEDVVLGWLAEVDRLRTQNQALLEALERIGNWGGTTKFIGNGSYTDVARAAIKLAEGKDV